MKSTTIHHMAIIDLFQLATHKSSQPLQIAL